MAFALSGSMGIVPMFIGAVVVGLLTTFLTQTLHQYAHVPSDASMGIVFTAMFALGVVLIKVFTPAGCTSTWPACTKVPLEYVSFAERVLGLAATVVEFADRAGHQRVVITLLWKEFKLSSFDPALATTMGFSATLDALLADDTGFGDDRRLVRSRWFDSGRGDADRAGFDGLFAHRSSWARWCCLSAAIGVLAAVLGYWGGDVLGHQHQRHDDRRRRWALSRWPCCLLHSMA